MTLRARPDLPGSLFAGSVLEGGENLSPLDAPTLTFRMTELVTATANFTPNPFLGACRTYALDIFRHL